MRLGEDFRVEFAFVGKSFLDCIFLENRFVLSK